MILNIANGKELQAYLTNKCDVGEDIMAFNESMVTGESTEKIFSDVFFHVRAKSLNINYEEYSAISIMELDKLLNKSYSKVILWFDEDMFCQINLLTLCAYLDYSKYGGIVSLNIIRKDFWQYDKLDNIVIKSYNINLSGYYSIYQDILINKVFTRNDYLVFEELQEGIKLYKNYTSGNSEIRSAIRAMIKDKKSKEDIIKVIIKAYPQYGIGDYNIKLLYQLEKDVIDGYNTGSHPQY